MFEYRVPLEHHITLPRNPNVLLSLAVGILGDAVALITEDFLSESDEQEEHVAALQLVEFKELGGEWDAGDETLRPESLAAIGFAASYFDAFIDSRLAEPISPELALLCSASYYLADAPGSARVVIKRTELPAANKDGGLARAAHSILSDDFAPIAEESDYKDLLERVKAELARYLSGSGDERSVKAACEKIRDSVYNAGTPPQLLYCDLLVALCRSKIATSSRRLLPEASALSLDAWRPVLAKPLFPRELWPAQRLIADAGVLEGQSAVIQMPTSAGKTRATELIIRSAFLSERTSLAVIVAPFRSLCHDIRNDLSRAFAGENTSIKEATDSYQLDLSIDDLLAQKSVLIVTPEKLLYMLRRRPDFSEQVGLVIYDEGHQFEGMARGPSYELLLTSLKITLPQMVQVVLISAVIGNAGDIAGWLLGDESAVVSGTALVPTPKSIAFASWATERGRLQYVSSLDPNEREFYVPRVIEETPLNRRGRERAERRFPESTGPDVGLFLGLKLVENGSVALFCGRKDSASLLCERAVEVFDRGGRFPVPAAVSDADEIARLGTLFRDHLGDAPIARSVALGILPHHASVPHGLRLAIEHAMREGLAKFVVCTSTLAQGVNFPIKYLIVTATQQGQERIMVRDFHNLIGRAGRAGMHTEGSIIFSAPRVYDERERSYEGRWRWGQVTDLLDPQKAEPIASSIAAVLLPYEQSHPPVTREITPEELGALTFATDGTLMEMATQVAQDTRIISQKEFLTFLRGRANAIQNIVAFLLAHVDLDHADASKRIEEMASNTLAFHLLDEKGRAQLTHLFGIIAASIVANADNAARDVVRRSPLPPAVTTALRDWLRHNQQILNAAAGEGFLHLVYEQVANYMSSSAARSLSEANVLRDVLQDWINGRSFAEIYNRVRQVDVRFGNRRPKIEDIVALCENGFGYDASMIVATLADLTEGDNDILHAAFSLLQRQVKYGLNNESAIAFFEVGFADRVVASDLGLMYPEVTSRLEALAIIRENRLRVIALLMKYPGYFLTVFREIIVA